MNAANNNQGPTLKKNPDAVVYVEEPELCGWDVANTGNLVCAGEFLNAEKLTKKSRPDSKNTVSK